MVSSIVRVSPSLRLLLQRSPTVPTLSAWLTCPSRSSHTVTKSRYCAGAAHPIFENRNANPGTDRQLGRMRYRSVAESPSMSQRLERNAYDADECRAALRGERIPLNLGLAVMRTCVVGGIRRHIAFARSPEVVELAALPGQEVFARARNASLIMHDQVPPEDAMRMETYPYCIWYPKVAKEETYRTLAQRYPGMRYQVGRACAVAGYGRLYRELNLLPEVSIAEEARENCTNPGAQAIFAEIMAAPMRHRVMDDYTRTISLDRPAAPAFLNADTAVVASLGIRRKFYHDELRTRPGPWSGFPKGFNIAEDWNVAEEATHWDPPELNAEELALFKKPLPLDLPSMNKTLLILYAAANGDVDRYARLRRQFRVRSEDLCLVRGCYHSTAMAAWLAQSPDVIESLKLDDDERGRLWRAIHARHVMDGSISHLLDPSAVPDNELPYWIWYPRYPTRENISKLAKARPAMRQQCLRASVAANYQDVFDEIMDSDPCLAPDGYTMKEAEWSSDSRYQEAIQRRIESLGPEHCTVPSFQAGVWHDWKDNRPYIDANPQQVVGLGCKLRDTDWELRTGEDGQIDHPYGFYEGYDLILDKVNSVLGMSEEERSKLDSMGCMCLY